MTNTNCTDMWITCTDRGGNSVVVISVHRSRKAAEKRAAKDGTLALRVGTWGKVSIIVGETIAIERQTPWAPPSFGIKSDFRTWAV